MQETWAQSLGWEDPLEKGKAIPTPVFWPGEFHGLYTPQGHKESDTTERLSLSYEVFIVVKFIETQSRRVVARDRARGMGSSCSVGTAFQVGKMKQFWRWTVRMVAQSCE